MSVASIFNNQRGCVMLLIDFDIYVIFLWVPNLRALTELIVTNKEIERFEILLE